MNSIPRSSACSGYLRWSTGIIAAITLLVCMVSLPRLQSYVQCNNEEDAARSLRVLGRAGSPGEAPDLATWIAQDRSLRHRFLDARVLEGSGLLMQHGYLFQMRRSEGRPPQFVAWPRATPRTGQAAFMWMVPVSFYVTPMRTVAGPAPMPGQRSPTATSRNGAGSPGRYARPRPVPS